MWNIVSKSATKLDDSQQHTLYKSLLQYCDIFSTDKHDLGHTNALKHRIDTRMHDQSDSMYAVYYQSDEKST